MDNFKALFLSIICSCICFFSSVPTAHSNDKVVVIPLNSKAQIVKKSFTLSIPPSSFVPSRPLIDSPYINFFEGDMAVLIDSTNAWMAAPVNLPEDAEIHYLECALYDNNSSNGFVSPGSSVTLWRRAITSISQQNMVSFPFSTSGASTSMKAVGTNVINNPVVKNSQYHYGLHVVMTLSAADQAASVRFYGCQISYYLDVVIP